MNDSASLYIGGADGWNGVGIQYGHASITLTGSASITEYNAGYWAMLVGANQWTNDAACDAAINLSGSSSFICNSGIYGGHVWGTVVGSTAHIEINITDTASLSLTDTLFCGDGPGGSGNLTMTSGGTLTIGTVDSRHELYVGGYLASTSTMTMSDTATVNLYGWSQVGRDSGTGVLIMHDSATFNCDQEFRIGVWGGNGTLEMYEDSQVNGGMAGGWQLIGVGDNAVGHATLNDNASFTATDAIDIGEGVNSQGIVVLNGNSSMTSLNSGIWIGNSAGGYGSVTLNDFSTLTCLNNEIEVPWAGTGVLNVGDGNPAHNAVVSAQQILIGWSTDSVSGTVNLNVGGTINTSHFYTDSNPIQSVINLNGGLLRATENQAAFISNTGAAADFQVNVLAGGAKIDSNGFNIKITEAITGSAGDGGLEKLGDGILTLTGAVDYTGPTMIDGGRLAIDNDLTTTLDTVTGPVRFPSAIRCPIPS